MLVIVPLLTYQSYMIGKVVGQYRIISTLGKGGMGVVFRARDEVLQRDVALKFIGEALAHEGKERLMHEARAASRLNHPNICTIHDIDEIDGEFYIVMELIEGKPLSELVGERGLAIDSVMRYGAQLANALAHAHSRSVVHRDLKSHNVIVTPEGLVKVLDFGLARCAAAKPRDGDSITATMDLSPTTGGTVGYMSPEALRGEAGDHRSDIWALGVVLYETAAGHLPFEARTTPEITARILRDPPAALPPSLPPGLSAIILRCLAKEPPLRYQSASEVQAAIEAVQSAAASPGRAGEQGPAHLTTVHRGVKHLDVKSGDVLLLAGTAKGLFLLRSSPRRAQWSVAGPYFPGQATYALALDTREGRRCIWAASSSALWGTFLRSSDDYGKTWTIPVEASIRFPAESGAILKNIWQICLGRPSEPDVMYCGVEPAALFQSRDQGKTWTLVKGLFDHPHRARWVPGMGGLCLHSVLLDPQDGNRMYTAISAGGVYATEDGGMTWEARNRGIRVTHMPDKYPEFGQCVHKIVMHPSRPERLFLQNHWGLYRSDDYGKNWHDIGYGVPSDFGFALAMHPHDPDCAYALPVESDEFRCTPEGRLRVYRTRNAGKSWEAMFRGLPQRGAYETVLRDGMTTDSLDPAGIYFGTRSGQLYGSTDEGKTWNRILAGLPAILCVKCAVITGQHVGAPRRTRAAADPGVKKRR